MAKPINPHDSSASADDRRSDAPVLLPLLRIVALAVITAFVVRTFFFELYAVPSESMEPTLAPGDIMVVSKASYGYSAASLPWVDLAGSGRALGRRPGRGDVVVFAAPDGRHIVKRLIGLPGDVVELRGGTVMLNGDPLVVTAGIDRTESMAGGRVYRTREDPAIDVFDNFGPVSVPDHYLFFLGDNRDNSNDSRIAPEEGGVGIVHEAAVVGQAKHIAFSLRGGFPGVSLARFGAIQ